MDNNTEVQPVRNIRKSDFSSNKNLNLVTPGGNPGVTSNSTEVRCLLPTDLINKPYVLNS